MIHTLFRRDISPRNGCIGCAYFKDDPTFIERSLQGLTSFSSAYASVRSADGLCIRHDVLVNGLRRCENFVRA